MAESSSPPTATNAIGVITTTSTSTSIVGSTPPPDPWGVVAYEIGMFCSDTLAKTQPSLALKNAAAESRLLHLRNLCEVFLEWGREADDIKMSSLFSDWATGSRYFEVKTTIDKLRSIYGKRDVSSSPRWHINKRLAHSTTHRAAADRYDYTPHLRDLVPTLLEVIEKIELLRGSAFERYQ